MEKTTIVVVVVFVASTASAQLLSLLILLFNIFFKVLFQAGISVPPFLRPGLAFISPVLVLAYCHTSVFSFLASSKYLFQTSDTSKPKYVPVQRTDSIPASFR